MLGVRALRRGGCGGRGHGGLLRGATFALATHFDYYGGTGDSYTQYDDTCDSNLVLPSSPGSYMNNRISSTINWSCGNAKHFTQNDFTGGGQGVSGPSLTPVNLGAPENDAVSSIAYS